MSAGARMRAQEILDAYEASGHLRRRSLCEELHEVCLRHSERRAVVAPDAELSYRQLDLTIAHWARAFLEAGLSGGDQVLVQLPNSAAYLVSLFALMRIGAVPTLMLPSHRHSELVRLARQLRPVAYIGGRDQLGFDCVAMVEEADPQELGIRLLYADAGPEHAGPAPCHRLPPLPGTADPEPPPLPVAGPGHRDAALNLLSGGTTSEPKIIPRVHEAYACNARAAALRCGIGPDSVYLAVLSSSHDFPLAQPGVLGTLLCGGTAVMCASAAFDEAFAAIEANRVTVTAIVPAVAQLWNEALEWYPTQLSSLRQILIGAARLDAKLGRSLMARTGALIQQGYGLGEGITTFTRLDDPELVALGTQGTPISDGDVLRIVDPQGRQLPAGVVGEIIEKGPYTFLGYHGAHADDDCFTADGFLRTGDRGYLDADGNLVVCGRVVEQINRLGENVSPHEIEHLLGLIGGVREAAVFGAPDEELGERTVAVVVTDGPLGRRRVMKDFEEQGIARYKVPDEVIVVDAIPRTNIGKVDKEALRAMTQQRTERTD